MTNLEEIEEILHHTKASLVVSHANGEIKQYYQDKIKDIKDILQENSLALKDAIIADKVIGKVAASILVVAGVREIYADIISEYAIPILEKNNIKYKYHQKVNYIKNQDNTGMCPMENKYKQEKNIYKIYHEMLNV